MFRYVITVDREQIKKESDLLFSWLSGLNIKPDMIDSLAVLMAEPGSSATIVQGNPIPEEVIALLKEKPIHIHLSKQIAEQAYKAQNSGAREDQALLHEMTDSFYNMHSILGQFDERISKRHAKGELDREKELLISWLSGLEGFNDDKELIARILHEPGKISAGEKERLKMPGRLQVMLQKKPLSPDIAEEIAVSAVAGSGSALEACLQNYYREYYRSDENARSFEEYVIKGSERAKFQLGNIQHAVEGYQKRHPIRQFFENLYWYVELLGGSKFDAQKLYDCNSANRASTLDQSMFILPLPSFPFKDNDNDYPYRVFFRLTEFSKNGGLNFGRTELETEKDYASGEVIPGGRQKGHVYKGVIGIKDEYMQLIEEIYSQEEHRSLAANILSGFRRPIGFIGNHDYFHSMTVPNPWFGFLEDKHIYAAAGSNHSMARNSERKGQRLWAQNLESQVCAVIGNERLQSLEIFSIEMNYVQWQEAIKRSPKVLLGEKSGTQVPQIVLSTIKTTIGYLDKLKGFKALVGKIKCKELGDAEGKKYADKMAAYITDFIFGSLLQTPIFNDAYINMKIEGKSLRDTVNELELPPFKPDKQRLAEAFKKDWGGEVPDAENIYEFLCNRRHELTNLRAVSRADFLVEKFMVPQSKPPQLDFSRGDVFDQMLAKSTLGHGLHFLMKNPKTREINAAKLTQDYARGQHFDFLWSSPEGVKNLYEGIRGKRDGKPGERGV